MFDWRYAAGAIFSFFTSEFAIGFWKHQIGVSHKDALIIAGICGGWVTALSAWKVDRLPLPLQGSLLTRRKSITGIYFEIFVWKSLPVIGLFAALIICKRHRPNRMFSIVDMLAAHLLMTVYVGHLWKIVFRAFAAHIELVVYALLGLALILAAYKIYRTLSLLTS